MFHKKWMIAACFAVLAGILHADSATVEARLAALEREILALRADAAQKDAKIADLQARLHAPQQPGSLLGRMTADLGDAHHDHDHGDHDGHDHDDHDGHHAEVFSPRLDIAAIVNVVAGGSTADDATLETLQGGGHDPKRRGFSLQQLELSLSGAVDPYFDLQADLVFVEDEVELEEAFADTTALPGGLGLRVGYLLTEFGRMNPAHPHGWQWLDQPVVNTRIFGAEGMRGLGARLSWQAPVSWDSALQLTVQQASGAFMASFDGEGLAHAHGDEGEEEHHDEDDEDDHAEHAFEEGIGGRPIQHLDVSGLDDFVYTLRFKNAFELAHDLSMALGATASYGMNNSGDNAHTLIYGVDLTLASHAGHAHSCRPKWRWQTEFIKREFEAAALTLEGDEPAESDDDLIFLADTLDDWGVYSEFVYALNHGWSLGFRAEYASGSGSSYEEGAAINRSEDPFRNNRVRLSPLLTYHPSDASRIRLQYNYDDADHLNEAAHTLWLGFEWLIGTHPAHTH